MTDAPKAPRPEARAGEDPYAWLRDEQWQAVIADPAKLSPAIRAYLEAENAYTDRVLAPLASLRTALVAEMRARIKEDDSTVPVPDGPFAYYSRHVPGGQHPIFCRSPRNGGAETVLLDGNAAAAGLAYFRVGSLQHSPDHRRLAWTVDTAGSEIFTLYVRDLDGGALIGAPVTGVHGGSVAWANDNATLFYTQLDAQHRPTKVFRHTAGATGADVLVYEEKDAAFYLGLGKTESEKFIVIGASSHANTSESWLIDADAPLAPPVLVEPRAAGIDYDVSHRGDTLYIRTNADGAEDYKIVTAPANMFQAEVLLKSVLRAGTANNDLNPVKSMGLLGDGAAIISRMTSTTGWYVQCDAPEGLKLMMRRKIEKSMEGDFDTDSMRYKATERYIPGWTDPRDFWGTAGV